MVNPIRRKDILIHNNLSDYRKLLNDDELSSNELMAIWDNMLGAINAYTVKVNYNDILRDLRMRNKAEEIVEKCRKEKEMSKFDANEYDNDTDREDEMPEANMDKMSQSLINMYQTESKRINTIIINEEQYKRLFK